MCGEGCILVAICTPPRRVWFLSAYTETKNVESLLDFQMICHLYSVTECRHSVTEC